MDAEVWIHTHTPTHTHITIYNGVLVTKNNAIMPFGTTWVDLEIIIRSPVSQKEKDKYHTTSLICGILFTMQMNISMK